MKKKITGVILAAGKGLRLGALTQNLPKPLLEVGGKPLLGHMVEFVRSIGIERIIVVGGYLFPQIKTYLEKYYPFVEVIENSRFDLQNILSFELGYRATHADESLFVCNADYVFQSHTKNAIEQTLESEDVVIYGSCDLSADASDVMKVSSDESEHVSALSKQLVQFNGIYTGMFYIPVGKRPTVDSIVRELVSTGDLTKTSVEFLFDTLIRMQQTVLMKDVGRADWIEVDTEEELILANSLIDIRKSI